MAMAAECCKHGACSEARDPVTLHTVAVLVASLLRLV